MRGRGIAALAVLAAVQIAAPAAAIGARAAAASVRVTVKPATGSPRTAFVVSFRAPASSGRSGSTVSAYMAQATGPSKRGCQSSTYAPVHSAGPGRQPAVKLAPSASSHWCAGTYHGRVVETIRPVCGYRKACPLFIALVTLGTFSFRVD